MNNHPGDPYSFLELRRLREEQLDRKARHRDLLAQVDSDHQGFRASVAGLFRAIASRGAASPAANPEPTAHSRRHPRAS